MLLLKAYRFSKFPDETLWLYVLLRGCSFVISLINAFSIVQAIYWHIHENYFWSKEHEVNNSYIYGRVLSLSWHPDSNGITNWKNKSIIAKKFITSKIATVLFISLRSVLRIILTQKESSHFQSILSSIWSFGCL